MKKIIFGSIAVAMLSVSGAAQSAFIMNTYNLAGNSGIAGVQSAVNAGTPTYTGTTNVINFWDGSGGSGNYSGSQSFAGNLLDNFGVDFLGYINVNTAGTYFFRSLADDGVQLKIDNTTLFTDSGYHSPQYREANIFLSAGLHAFDFMFFEGGGGATVELETKFGSTGTYSLLGNDNSVLQTSTTANNVPEPTSIALFALGALGFSASRRKTKV